MSRYFNENLYHSDLELADDELAHYGRLGMKWYKNIFGRQKALSKAVRIYERKKSSQKRNELKAAKALKKGDMDKYTKLQNKANKKANQANRLARKANAEFYDSTSPFYRRNSDVQGQKFTANYMAETRDTNVRDIRKRNPKQKKDN